MNLFTFSHGSFRAASNCAFMVRLLCVASFVMMQAISSSQAADQEVSDYPSTYTWIKKEAQVYLHVRGAGMRTGFFFVLRNEQSGGNVLGEIQTLDPAGNFTYDDPAPRRWEWSAVNTANWVDFRCQWAGYSDGTPLTVVSTDGRWLSNSYQRDPFPIEPRPTVANPIHVWVYLGTATPPLPPNIKPCDDKSGGNEDCDGCGGMARYSVHSMLASLNIHDTPLRYSPPRGPAINFSVTYNQKESQQPTTFTYSNLGPKWTFNWLSYVTDDPNTQLPLTYVYVPGGGAEIYQFDSGLGTFLPNPQSHSFLIRTPQNTYEKIFPDGSRQIFDRADSSSYPRRLFMTEMVDPANNRVRIDYDPVYYRINKIKDALWQDGATDHETTIYYDDWSKPLRITRVGDPYGRFVYFEYDETGKLTNITDVIGIVSQVTYSPGTDSIDSLTTPYGTTAFQSGQSGTNRWIEITDPPPLGGKERVEYRDNAPGISATEPSNSVPTGFTNAGLNVANTFYWDKKAMAEAPGDYTKATIKHWFYDSNGSLSGILSSEKKPLENRVWYMYLGQSDYQHAGPSANPSQVARVLGDGTTQLSQFEYNNTGKTTKATDPAGRVTSYIYDSNQIDLLEIRQTTGANNELVRQFGDYYLHQPRTDIDAAGQPAYFTYNTSGQILTRTNAIIEQTIYAYGDGSPAPEGSPVPVGYLASITSPAINSVSAVTRFQYDGFNRVRTVINPDGYKVTTDYDHLDRKTTVTYLDTTYEEFQYTQDFGNGETTILDLTASRDRLGKWTYRHYNENRQMDSMTDPLNRTTLYGWCTCGSLESITDSNWNVTTFHRDLQSRVYQKVFADFSTIDYLYEGQTAPNTTGATSRLKASTDTLGHRTNYSYFKDDNISQVSYTDISGNQLIPATPLVSYTYDSNYNRIARMNDGTGQTDYEYYPITSSPAVGAGQLQTIDGPLVNDTIAFAYDQLGRVLSRSINGVAETVGYDSLGRPTATDNALGHFGRLYDGVTPRLQTLAYPNGVTAGYTYFGNNEDRRLQTLENLSTAETAPLSKFDYTYDDDGEILTWNRELGEKTSGRWFEYDDARQLLSARNQSSVTSATQVNGYVYDVAGNRTYDSNFDPQGRVGNGTFHSYSPNPLNQIDSFSTQVGTVSYPAVELTYDLAGNLVDNGEGKTFEWDAANRLSAINYAGGQRTEFAYDGLGRRVKITEYGPGVTATIQPSGTDYTKYSAAPFAFPSGHYSLIFEGLNSSDGNVLLIDSVALSNTLVANGSFESPDVSSEPGGYQYNPTDATWNYVGDAGLAYNGSDLTSGNPDAPDGKQVAFLQNAGYMFQIRTVGAGTYALNFYAAQRDGNTMDQQVRVNLRPSGAAISIKRFLWCGSQICEERDSSGGTVTKRFFAEGEQRMGGSDVGNYYYSRDHLGSIREITDSSGHLKARYDYDPYGKSVVVDGNMNVDFGYTGHYHHAPSGLNLTLYRAYNPDLGRWLSRDPIGEDGGINLYGYVENDPLNRIDALGKQAQLLVPIAFTIEEIISGGAVSVFIWHAVKEACETKKCPPCPAPPPPEVRIDYVPPSRPHYPCPGSHTHFITYEYNQEPFPSCRCRLKKVETVTCF